MSNSIEKLETPFSSWVFEKSSHKNVKNCISLIQSFSISTLHYPTSSINSPATTVKENLNKKRKSQHIHTIWHTTSSLWATALMTFCLLENPLYVAEKICQGITITLSYRKTKKHLTWIVMQIKISELINNYNQID